MISPRRLIGEDVRSGEHQIGRFRALAQGPRWAYPATTSNLGLGRRHILVRKD